MIKEVCQDLYQLTIPLPNTPLKSLNSYVIKGTERNLIIDTGFNLQPCLDAMHLGLKELGVDLSRTDIFITHAHADHSGNVSNLVTDTSIIYCGKEDAYIFDSSSSKINIWTDIHSFMWKHGFPETDLDTAVKSHPGYKYSSLDNLNHKALEDGDIIRVGSYMFRCVSTPGHSIGHMCLYEPDKKLLIAGDHILGNISPVISLWNDYDNPLDDYLQSLEKVEALDVDLVLPGHRSTVHNCGQRIQELKQHHKIRVNQVLAALEQGEKTAYQVAAQLSWRLTYESWDMFPPAQKLFAMWETIAHLKYVEVKQMIKREFRGQKVVFMKT